MNLFKLIRHLGICVHPVLILCISCNNKQDPGLLGKLPVKGVDSVYFKVYQEDKPESSVAIYYEIVDGKDSIISPKIFLIGTSDFDRHDTKDFFADSHDSIIYLSFIKPNVMYAIFDLKTKKYGFSFGGDTQRVDKGLSDRLKSFNPNLKEY